MVRIQIGNLDGAIEFIQRHAPDQMDLLNANLKHRQIRHSSIKSKQSSPKLKVVQQTILIDDEAGRIAKVVGQFAVFRAWAYAHTIDNGNGRIEREELENVSKQEYWTYDPRTKRIYLSGQLRVVKRLDKSAIECGLSHIGETNKPGKRRIKVDLSGSLQESSARLYASWMAAKDQEREGITISRDVLYALWDVSIPTLLTWEKITHIDKQSNYAQQNDTSIDKVPPHTYLTLNRDGSHSTAWRLPNTYTVTNKSIQEQENPRRSGKWFNVEFCKPNGVVH